MKHFVTNEYFCLFKKLPSVSTLGLPAQTTLGKPD